MNKYVMDGFNDEMQKLSTSVEDGVKGLGVGAMVGAILSAVGTEALERLVTRNKDLAIITGAIMGAGALGSAGFLLGGKNKGVNVIGSNEVTPEIYSGVPAIGARHI